MLWLVPVAVIVIAFAGYVAISLQPHGNPSGQQSSDPNERCSPSPCGAPAGFEVDVTAATSSGDHIVLTVMFRNHTKSQPFEAVSYRHTSPVDFTLQAGGHVYAPVFNQDCPNWPELDVPRGAASPPRNLCFAVRSTSGAQLVWNPDLGVIPEPVSIGLDSLR